MRKKGVLIFFLDRQGEVSEVSTRSPKIVERERVALSAPPQRKEKK